MRYAIVIEKGPANYAVYVPDLPGCIATGATVAETESLSSQMAFQSPYPAAKSNTSTSPLEVAVTLLPGLYTIGSSILGRSGRLARLRRRYVSNSSRYLFPPSSLSGSRSLRESIRRDIHESSTHQLAERIARRLVGILTQRQWFL